MEPGEIAGEAEEDEEELLAAETDAVVEQLGLEN